MARHALNCEHCGTPVTVSDADVVAVSCGTCSSALVNRQEAEVEKRREEGWIVCYHHKKYKALRPPTSRCPDCWSIYNYVMRGNE